MRTRSPFLNRAMASACHGCSHRGRPFTASANRGPQAGVGADKDARGRQNGRTFGATRRSTGLQVAAAVLVAFDGLEQRLEVAFAETACAFTLDDLEEHGGSIGDGLGEDLQQVTVLVTI